MNKDILTKTIARLLLPGKGLLAIDEKVETCDKRFEKLGVPTTEEKRREYREILVTAPEMEKYISGYILFDETIRQKTKDGRSFTSVLKEKGIEIGIKADQGLIDFPMHLGEKITQGLDGLSERLKEYKNMGATFAKWRAVFTIGENIPSRDCMEENAKLFAQYALTCQKLNIVPIVEPEILIEGDYSLEKSYEITAQNLKLVFHELKNLNVFIPGMILKTSMVIPGNNPKITIYDEEIAKMTVSCLKKNVPADIGGIVFLSGGQEDEAATEHLNLMHKMGPLPWPLTFSYGRAIQNKTLQSWAHNPEDIATAQALLLTAAQNNSQASIGQYKK